MWLVMACKGRATVGGCITLVQRAARPAHAQVLKAGDAVVAAARRPEQSPGLTELKNKHGDALHLVTLDVTNSASLKVQTRGTIVPASGAGQTIAMLRLCDAVTCRLRNTGPLADMHCVRA